MLESPRAPAPACVCCSRYHNLDSESVAAREWRGCESGPKLFHRHDSAESSQERRCLISGHVSQGRQDSNLQPPVLEMGDRLERLL
jgi:hypothetical protein